MKKVLALTFVVMMTMASGLAQTSRHAGSVDAATAPVVNRAAVQKAAAAIKATPLIAVTGTATAGYLPMFTDAAGDVSNSSLFQGSNGFLGLGTTNPAFPMHFISQGPSNAVVAVDGYGAGVGVAFIGRHARGTLAAPTALLADDNIFTIQGRGYYSSADGTNQGFTPSSRAFIKIFAAENWTDTAQGAYISFATTPKGTTPGSASATEKMRLTDAGSLGVGTIAPSATLEVNGTAKFDGLVTFAVGQTFPGTGISLSSADGSITVGGTATAPTVALNPVVLQTAIGASGTAVSVPVKVAQTSFTGSYGLGATNAIYTPKADGFYRVSVYMNVPTYGTCATAPCAGEAVTIQWNDGVSTTALATANCNLVTPCGSSVVTPIWVKSGQTITAYGQSYGSGAAPAGGTYNAYVLVEQQ